MKIRAIFQVSIILLMSWVCNGQSGGMQINYLSAKEEVSVGTVSGYHTDVTDRYISLAPLTKAEISAITPQPGSIVYDTDSDIIKVYNGTKWKSMIAPPADPCPATVTYDEQTYQTVLIGEQCWMAENLNVGTQIPGASEMSDNGTIEKYCYDNDEANCITYGGLYQWNEAMAYSITPGARGICPEGWHIPSDEEWIILEENVDSGTGTDWSVWNYRGTDVGLKLKSISWDGNNISGFNALRAGQRSIQEPRFTFIDNWTTFWSSTPGPTYNDPVSITRQLFNENQQIKRGTHYLPGGMSIRCLHD